MYIIHCQIRGSCYKTSIVGLHGKYVMYRVTYLFVLFSQICALCRNSNDINERLSKVQGKLSLYQKINFILYYTTGCKGYNYGFKRNLYLDRDANSYSYFVFVCDIRLHV